MSNLLNKEKGFTLIEIVLVLAIAGLILVIVFLALTGAQKSRRDTTRKTQAGEIAAQLEQFASNNNGNYPGSTGTLTGAFQPYLTPASSYTDPSSGFAYTMKYTTNAPATPTTAATTTVSYHDSEKCGTGANVGTMQPTTSTRDWAILMYQEAGLPYCHDNQ